MARISVINCSCKVSGRRATYINSRADAFPHSPASAHPLPPVLASSLVDVHIHIPLSPSPIIDLAMLLLKIPFIAPSVRRAESDRCNCLARATGEKSPSFRVFLLTSGTFRRTTVALPRLHPPRYENLFIPLPLSFLFSFCDNASTFGFYTSDVVSNFVSLSFRREETHETVALPLRKLVVPPATLLSPRL